MSCLCQPPDPCLEGAGGRDGLGALHAAARDGDSSMVSGTHVATWVASDANVCTWFVHKNRTLNRDAKRRGQLSNRARHVALSHSFPPRAMSVQHAVRMIAGAVAIFDTSADKYFVGRRVGEKLLSRASDMLRH